MISVTVYKRHSADCAHKDDRSFKRCTCIMWMEYYEPNEETGKPKQIRESAKTRSWQEAQEKALAKAAELKHKQEGAERGEPTAPASVEKITIEKAVASFLSDKRTQGLQSVTLKKLETNLQKQMLGWCRQNGLVYLADFTLAKLGEWRNTWEDSLLTKQKKQQRVISFWKYCDDNEWVTKNVAKKLSKFKPKEVPKVPFTQQEFAKIIAAIDRFGQTDVERKRLRALTLLMRWSGLAIRDAVTLKRECLDDKNRIMLYRAKTGQPVFVPIPEFVAQELRALPVDTDGKYFFWSGDSDANSAVGHRHRSFQRLFELADLKNSDGTEKRCSSHMFRNTFAREAASAGISLEDRARLLGHASVKTTERYYNAFVQESADELEATVREKMHRAMGIA